MRLGALLVKILKYSFALILVVIAVISGFLLVTGIVAMQSIPSEMILSTGSLHTLDTSFPLTLSASDEGSVDVITLNGNSLADVAGQNFSSLEIGTKNSGETVLQLELFGIIPVKEITVTVEEERKLIPGGQSIGVMLYTNGALVVGGSDILTQDGYINPSKEAGLLSGDIIEEVNGHVIRNSEHLTELINDISGEISVTINRNGDVFDMTITPVLDTADEKMKIGVWVRDSTAGVGTMTFIDPKTMRFAGLGHAITDVDTGKQLSVKEGEIVFSEILDIIPGQEGEPGELKGFFDQNSQAVGELIINSDFGIYGEVQNLAELDMSSAVSVLPMNEVALGEATLLCTVDGNEVKEYSCVIESTKDQSSPEIKSFVINITDSELLSQTGGIVQGMSGSPILQDGKLVGCVTHVFVNDPTRGYGIYADWMLEMMNW